MGLPTWLAWTLLWTVLVLGAAAVYVLLAVRLWRSARALLAETSTVLDRLLEVGEAIEELAAAQEAGRRPPAPAAAPAPLAGGERSRPRRYRATALD